MKIYLAGLMQTGFVWRGGSKSEDVLITEDIRRNYPYDLESYHYIGSNQRAMPYLKDIGKSIFLDSGAFSMFTQGIKVDLQKYADYCIENSDVIHVASNLDEIGRGKERESYENQKTLERMGAKIMPVHHARDRDEWLGRYINEGYDYIFLGGMVPESTPYLRRWLDRIWDKYLTNPDGTAKIKVHGFGLTNFDLMWRYPWYSVDSTTWVLAGRYGFVLVDLPGGIDKRLTFSDQSPTRKDLGVHIDTMDPVTRAAVEGRIVELGYTVDQLRTRYGWRDHANIAFFQRLMERPPPRFKKTDIDLFENLEE